MLGNISKYGVERAAGFSDLRTEDRDRVRVALKERRVEPTNVTGSASASSSGPAPVPQPSQVPPSPSQQPSPSTKKRKAEAVVPDPLQTKNVPVVTPSPTQAAYRQAAMGGTAWEEGVDAQEVLEQQVDQVDELYCTLPSNVVGIQYYKGVCVSPSRPLFTSFLS
jgi:SWI/SNF-related matrix-associated actin-dependent regulator of chromatin subfamily A3